MNIGDYVRTEDGEIYKVLKIEEPIMNIGGAGFSRYGILEYYDREEKEKARIDFSLYKKEKEISIYNERYSFKSSPNIIDLLEVGDLIKLYSTKQIQQVLAINEEEIDLTDYVYYDLKKSKQIIKEDIEWVITHEQIENMKYKVE